MDKVAGFALLILLLIGCKSNYQKTQQKETSKENDSVSAINDPSFSERNKLLADLFINEPKLDIPLEYFTIETDFGNSLSEMDRYYFYYREEKILPRTKQTGWVRSYIIGKDTTAEPFSGSSFVEEYRFYNNHDQSNYIIAINWRSCYIRWKNKLKKGETWCTDDIGTNTVYLETNLTEEIIRSIFKDVSCPVIIKHPKSVTMDFLYFQRLILLKEGNRDAIINPIFRY